jgi:hypothetical protein
MIRSYTLTTLERRRLEERLKRRAFWGGLTALVAFAALFYLLAYMWRWG